MIGLNDVSLLLCRLVLWFITMGGQPMNGAPATQDFEPNLTSEPSVRALQHIDRRVGFSPSGVTSYGFTESVDASLRQRRSDDLLVDDRWFRVRSRAFPRL